MTESDPGVFLTHVGGWKSDVKMTARIRVGKHYMEPRQERVLLPAHLHGKPLHQGRWDERHRNHPTPDKHAALEADIWNFH